MKTSTSRLAQHMRQHPLVSFYLMAFGWTWLVDLLILSLWRQPSGAGGDALRLIIPAVVGAPTFPALIMTALTQGRAGMGQLLRRCVRWRVGLQWYLFVLVGFPALILLGLLVPPGGITGLREPVPALVESYVPVFIIILLVGGPLPEEPAWRGFALPRLEQCLGPLRGTLLLGLLWGLWHFPLFLFILYASKMIMRPERESKEPRDSCPEQKDYRYGAGPQQESEPTSENAVPDPRAVARKCRGNDYVSRLVARPSRAIQCGWHQDHKQAYTPGITAPSTR
jgi:membrane protease YdiL (CAAX protease family)